MIPDLYQRMDRLIGRVMEQIDDDTLLLVISDHGFKSFARCLNLNAWLHQNGYLALKDGKTESGDWFEDVDWSRTRAYTMGLNGLYLNVRGREKQGIVDPAEARGSEERIAAKVEWADGSGFGRGRGSPACSSPTTFIAGLIPTMLRTLLWATARVIARRGIR